METVVLKGSDTDEIFHFQTDTETGFLYDTKK